MLSHQGMQRLRISFLIILATANLCSYARAETTQLMPTEYSKIKSLVNRIASKNNLGGNPILFTVVPGTYAVTLAESLRLCEKDNCNYYGQISPYKQYNPQVNEILRQSFLYGDINAWAHPHGTIEISLNTFRIYGANEDYLACTLAHELSHVIKNSSYEISKEASARVSLTKANDEIKKLIEAEVGREDEIKADKDAYVMTARAGFAKDACIKGIDFIHRVSGDGRRTEPDSTHPGAEERIAALEAYATTNESLQNIQKVEATSGHWEYNAQMNYLKFTPAPLAKQVSHE
jgi:Zn-dependent protease with chaperone function